MRLKTLENSTVRIATARPCFQAFQVAEMASLQKTLYFLRKMWLCDTKSVKNNVFSKENIFCDIQSAKNIVFHVEKLILLKILDFSENNYLACKISKIPSTPIAIFTHGRFLMIFTYFFIIFTKI